jgi:GNAT superfamily N-acetyltransferase
MTARHFTLDYEEHAELRDGTPVLLRLLRPTDKELLRAGFELLSPESRYARFFAPKTSLSEDELRYLTEVDHEDHVAIGAASERDGEQTGLGVARFIRLADRPETAEAAIAVADGAQRKGLGRLLLLRLVAAARERGIERFRFEVLASNTGMAALIAEIAPERTIETAAGALSIEVALPEVEPSQPALAAPVGSAIYRLFRAAAANAIEWTEAVRRLWRR